MKKAKYEDYSEIIDKELAKRRKKWQLSSLAYIDFEDVCQIIRQHIFEKWHLWNQERPFEQWVNTVITNRTINLVRDHYGNVAPPCNSCSFSLWGDHCEYTPSGMKCEECPLYKTWAKAKKAGYNIKMATSIHAEDYVERKSESINFDASIDIEKYVPNFHKLMKKRLSARAYEIYKALYIEKGSDEDALKLIKGDSFAGKMKKLNSMKRNFLKAAQFILQETDLLT